MSKDQAKRAFRAGRYHPHCPGCYQQTGLIQRMAATINGMTVRAYECKCTARFIAYIL